MGRTLSCHLLGSASHVTLANEKRAVLLVTVWLLVCGGCLSVCSRLGSAVQLTSVPGTQLTGPGKGLDDSHSAQSLPLRVWAGHVHHPGGSGDIPTEARPLKTP